MSGILDIVETEAEDYGFDYKYDSNRYGATVTVLTDEGDVILVVNQSYYEPIVTCCVGEDGEEEVFDDDWEEDAAKDFIRKALEYY